MNKAIRTCDVNYQTVDEALKMAIPLDVLDIIIGYTRHDKTRYQSQLVEHVKQNVQTKKISPIFTSKVNYMLGKINRIDGRLNKMYLSFMLFDYICDFSFLYRNSSKSFSFINATKDKLNFFYFKEKIVNARIYYNIITGEDFDTDITIISIKKHRRLCSLCRLPGHDKRNCEQLNLFNVAVSFL